MFAERPKTAKQRNYRRNAGGGDSDEEGKVDKKNFEQEEDDRDHPKGPEPTDANVPDEKVRPVKVPGATVPLSIQSTENRGRGIFTRQSIKAGTPLLHEVAYAAVGKATRLGRDEHTDKNMEGELGHYKQFELGGSSSFLNKRIYHLPGPKFLHK
ncbi:hypothetical protein HK104_008659 [Borealophlyctis nickersoniae]|nr:hypothetical protein HK104_008659 [Borealophlyctis nickersoniae]